MTPALHLFARNRGRYGSLATALLLLATVIYLLGNNRVPLIDRDEPRYAQASRQMMQSGDWITPMYLDEPRLKKPILIYWLQASSMRWLGDTAFAARLPSVVASLLTLAIFLLTWPQIVGHRRSIWATFIFATMLLPTYLAKVCMTDAVLHLFIASAMLCLYAIWIGKARAWMLAAMGLALGGSILTKGPPAFLFLGMTLLALWILRFTIRNDAPSRSALPRAYMLRVFVWALIVLGIAVGVCVPWAMKLEAAHPGALLNMLFDEVVKRGREPQEGHTGPPGFYFVTFWGMAFPWCLLWPAALWHGWQRRSVPWVRFSLAAILGPWVFLELYKTKLPHYWLPSYPFMALLIADVLLRGMRGRITDFLRAPFVIATGITSAFIAVLGIGLLLAPSYGEYATSESYIAAAGMCLAMIVCTFGVFELIRRHQTGQAAIAMGLGFWTIVAFAWTLFVPATTAFTLSKRVGETLRKIGATRNVVMIEFKEPSLAFYQGGTIREQTRETLVDTTISSKVPQWIVISDDILQQQSAELRSGFTIIETFRGMNLADGRREQTVSILERKSSSTTLPAQNR